MEFVFHDMVLSFFFMLDDGKTHGTQGCAYQAEVVKYTF